jgi:hypothetical protein
MYLTLQLFFIECVLGSISEEKQLALKPRHGKCRSPNVSYPQPFSILQMFFSIRVIMDLCVLMGVSKAHAHMGNGYLN